MPSGRQRPAARRLVRRDGARAASRARSGTASSGTTARRGGSRSRRILAYLILAGSLGDDRVPQARARVGRVLQRLVPRPRRRRRLLQRAGQRPAVPARHRAPQGQPLDVGLPLLRARYLAAVYPTCSSPSSRWSSTSSQAVGGFTDERSCASRRTSCRRVASRSTRSRSTASRTRSSTRASDREAAGGARAPDRQIKMRLVPTRPSGAPCPVSQQGTSRVLCAS